MSLAEAAALFNLRKAKSARRRAKVAALEAGLRAGQAIALRRHLEDAPATPLCSSLKAISAEIERAERALYESEVRGARRDLEIVRGALHGAA